MMMRHIAAFEWRYQVKSPVFWVGSLLFFLLTFGSVTVDQIQIGARGYTLSDTTANGRRSVHFRPDAPLNHFFSIQSAALCGAARQVARCGPGRVLPPGACLQRGAHASAR